MSAFPNLLSPLRINGTYLKTRICFPNAPVHFLQGPESFPAESFIAFHAGLARAGASFIQMGEWNNANQRNEGMEDSRHMPYFDVDDPSVKNYMSQLADEIHFYGGKLCVGLRVKFPEGYSLNGGKGMSVPGHHEGPTDPLPVELMDEVIDTFIKRVAMYKDIGYDMISVSVNVGESGFNFRTDEYDASSIENSNRFNIRVLRKVKEVFGPDFLVESTVYGEKPGSYTTEQLIDVLKLYEGLIDIVTLREKDLALSHPTGFTFQKGEHATLDYARKLKAAGVRMAVAVNGGFQDPVECEQYIADGVCDMISMGRGLFAEPELEKKMREGRVDDITPCIWCNKCHGVMAGPWLTYCSVNPTAGIVHNLPRMIAPAAEKRRVAVIGGGPVGMRAAIFAAQRGHDVTLFEKTSALGGQLKISEFAAFKWPHWNFIKYLCGQVEKSGVNVMYNSAPSPEDVAAMGFDAVIAATGAVPTVPKIKGAANEKGGFAEGIWNCIDVYGREKELGKRVVLVGASETGTETAVYLCQNGHEVYALTRRDEIAADASKIHGMTMSWIEFKENPTSPLDFRPRPEWEKYENFHGITGATTVEVGASFVKYLDKDGAEHTIECDSVVLSGGVTPQLDEALAYSQSAPFFFAVGDCNNGKNLQVGMRQAFAAANSL